MKVFSIFLLIFGFSFNLFAQNEQPKKDAKTKSADEKQSSSSVETPLILAKNAVKAHGGDKFKNMKSLVVRGVADISAGGPSSTLQGAFATVISGEKYRIEIQNPFRPFSQTFDGQNTYSSLGGNFSLPPINRLGLPLLQKIEEQGFTVSALGEDKKKKKGFRITSPEEYYTDFFIDEKTGQIKSYEAQYFINNQMVTTSVEIDKLREVEGVLIPEKYAQRFELGQITAYVEFKAKEILVNSKIEDDVFTMPKQ